MCAAPVYSPPRAGAEALAGALRDPACPLVLLDLSCNSITDRGGARATPHPLTAAHPASSTYPVPASALLAMARLRANWPYASAHAGLAIASALLSTASTPAAASSGEEEGCVCSRLAELSLAWNSLGDATAAALGGVLAAQGRAGRCCCAGAGAEAAGGLLRLLSLDGNSAISPACVAALAEGIRAAGAWLEGIDLTDTGVYGADESGALLREAAERWLRGGPAGKGASTAAAAPCVSSAQSGGNGSSSRSGAREAAGREEGAGAADERGAVPELRLLVRGGGAVESGRKAGGTYSQPVGVQPREGGWVSSTTATVPTTSHPPARWRSYYIDALGIERGCRRPVRRSNGAGDAAAGRRQPASTRSEGRAHGRRQHIQS